MKIQPIRTDADHAAALRRIDRLMDAAAGTPEADELDVLATLVEAYEDRHFPVADPDPLVAIQFRMEQLGLTRKDLEPLLGSRGRVSEVLNGRRALSLQMIRRLHANSTSPWRVSSVATDALPFASHLPAALPAARPRSPTCSRAGGSCHRHRRHRAPGRRARATGLAAVVAAFGPDVSTPTAASTAAACARGSLPTRRPGSASSRSAPGDPHGDGNAVRANPAVLTRCWSSPLLAEGKRRDHVDRVLLVDVPESLQIRAPGAARRGVARAGAAVARCPGHTGRAAHDGG